MSDIVGSRFGRLIVNKELPRHATPGGQKKRKFLCSCDCGGGASVMRSNLVRGNTTSCGCYMKERAGESRLTHGETTGGRSRVYVIWMNMVARCTNEHSSSWEYYGARGVKVCDRWRKFDQFFSDMGEPPTDHHSLDRKDTSGNYESGNCRWATMKAQQNNKTNNIRLTYCGQTKTISEWAEICGIKRATIRARIKVHRWPVDKALTIRADRVRAVKE